MDLCVYVHSCVHVCARGVETTGRAVTVMIPVAGQGLPMHAWIACMRVCVRARVGGGGGGGCNARWIRPKPGQAACSRNRT